MSSNGWNKPDGDWPGRKAATGNIHPVKPGTITAAGHPSVDIPPGTLNNIL